MTCCSYIGATGPAQVLKRCQSAASKDFWYMCFTSLAKQVLLSACLVYYVCQAVAIFVAGVVAAGCAHGLVELHCVRQELVSLLIQNKCPLEAHTLRPNCLYTVYGVLSCGCFAARLVARLVRQLLSSGHVASFCDMRSVSVWDTGMFLARGETPLMCLG